jgi:MFS-type transporter involved in bile tolerance (Atg22 family)
MDPNPESVVTRTRPVVAGSWIAYDVANTVYHATVTWLLGPYVLSRFDDTTWFGATLTISMIVAGVCTPFFAAIADRTGKSLSYLIGATLLCIAAMFGLGGSAQLGGALGFGPGAVFALLMVAFGIANFGHQTALVFYNSLLPSVASGKRIGLVSGLGIGLGYIAVLGTLAVLLPLSEAQGPEAAFHWASAAFLLLALPCFFVVREKRVLTREEVTKKLLAERARSVFGTIRGLPKNRNMMWFLIGNFMAVDVLNTAIIYFAAYSLSVFGGQEITLFSSHFDLRLHVPALSDAVAQPGAVHFLTIIGLVLNSLALVWGIAAGWMSDKKGALPVLRTCVVVLALALFGGIAFAGNGLKPSEVKDLKEASLAVPRGSIAPDGTPPEKLRTFAEGHEARVVAADHQMAADLWKAVPAERREHWGADAAPPPYYVIERDPPPPWLPTIYVISIAIFGSLGLAGTWSAGRKLLLDLAPREQVGEYFGLYGITNKLSVLASLIFGAVMEYVSPAAAMGTQVVFALIALAVLSLVRLPKAGAVGPGMPIPKQAA